MPNPTGAYDPGLAPWIAVLPCATTTAILQDGFDTVEGLLLDARGWEAAKPADLRAAAGLADDTGRAFVDIATVVPHELMTIAAGRVSATRYPTGTCLIRVDPDGSRRLLTYFDGPAYGWRNGRGFADPATTPGPRATWQGARYAAAFVPGEDELIELVAAGDSPPEGFDWSRPGISRAIVPRAEVTLTA